MPTERETSTATKLERIAWLSKQDPLKKFGCLMHHFNEGSLRAAFHKLDRRKAVGVDKVDKESYGQRLEGNLASLVNGMKEMSYRPGAVREALIPKEGKLGATRPLGISNLEDKLVQSTMAQILESIYEPLFLDCSFGFRKGRGCHDAIRGLRDHLATTTVRVVLDVDLENFFGTIPHRQLDAILRIKISDTRFMQYVNRMFKAGVLSEGELRVTDEGVPQGSICSPILANIFAHYVIDIWFESTVKKHCRGRVELFRYCDDFVICCESSKDARRIEVALSKRLNRFGLKLNEAKTKLVNFNKMDHCSGIRQGTFDFLGFSFYIGRSRNGRSIPKLKTSGKRLSSKLKRVNEWSQKVRNLLRLNEIWDIFRAKLRGHINYYSVSFNQRSVNRFIYAAVRILFKWLNRRSQRHSFTWESFTKFQTSNPLPKVVVKHSLQPHIAM
jgi:RNA-directed DNA polymerase